MKLLTYPNRAAGGQRLTLYLKELGIESTNDIEDVDVTHLMHYNYSNRVDECPVELVQKANDMGVSIINEHLLNIKKDYLDVIFTEVFGYSLLVDPTKHYGVVYMTSTQNAIHLHRLIQCPIRDGEVDRTVRPSNSGEPHYRIYRRWIDTRISPDTIRDFRVVVMGGEVVYLMEKHLDYMSVSHAMKGKKFNVYGHKTMDRFFTKHEQWLIHKFIQRIGADFVELDILRDNSTGLMYIIDANPVPAGPGLKMCGDDAVQYMSEIFKQNYL